MILVSLLLTIIPQDGLKIAILLLSISLILVGIRYITFYRSMARHMIGGRWILIIGVIILDFGIFSLTMHRAPLGYVILYLVGAYAFSGVVDILGAIEARGYEAPAWKLKFSTGVINVLIALFAMFSGMILHAADTVIWIYCAGLFYSGIMRIINAFRKNAIVYIQ